MSAAETGWSYELKLPWTSPPLSLNHRRGWRAEARLVAEVRRAGYYLAKQAKLTGPWPRIRVTLHYVPRDRRTRDAENPTPTLKALCDGLVDAGVVVDDDPAHMVKDMPVIHDPTGLAARLWLVVAEASPDIDSPPLTIQPHAGTATKRRTVALSARTDAPRGTSTPTERTDQR